MSSSASLSGSWLERLHSARAAEKDQALYYRSLAARAEGSGRADFAERLNGLHADEQHHFSRLSARLVELGEAVEDLSAVRPAPRSLDGWEVEARRREDDEIARYTALLQLEPDARTAAMIHEFLEVERRHRSVLGGKWVQA